MFRHIENIPDKSIDLSISYPTSRNNYLIAVIRGDTIV